MGGFFFSLKVRQYDDIYSIIGRRVDPGDHRLEVVEILVLKSTEEANSHGRS